MATNLEEAKQEIREITNATYAVDAPRPVLHVEWNLNRYIKDPVLVNNLNLMSKRQRAQTDKIRNHFGPDNIVAPNHSPGSAYIVQGTEYYDCVFRNNRARSENSWHADTSWMMFGPKAKFKYFMSAFKSNDSGNLPMNAGHIVYTWSKAKPANKLFFQFNNHSAAPANWTVEIDVGSGWEQIASDVSIGASGAVSLYRQTEGDPDIAGTWSASDKRWRETNENHVNLLGIRIAVSKISRRNARLEIVEVSPRLECNLTSMLTNWSGVAEMSDKEYVAPIGTASANTGSVTLSNNTGLFDEQVEDGLLYDMLDEQVEFRLFLDYGIGINEPVFTMFSETWSTDDRNTATVTLYDKAAIYQNIHCPDILIQKYTAASALHYLFAMLGLPQFDLIETEPKESPVLEFFYTRREDTLWQIIQELCKSLQMAAFFNAQGQLEIWTKEAAFNLGAPTDYVLTSGDTAQKKGEIFKVTREESTRYNKVTVRYSALNQLSASGGKFQHLWEPQDDYTIGAAQIVENIHAGDTEFRIDPHRPYDLPHWSGKVAIEHTGNLLDTAGHKFYCQNAPEGQRFIVVGEDKDWYRAIEQNNGEAPKFTGYIKLDDDQFSRDFFARNYSFREQWNIVEYTEGSAGATRINNSAHHDPYKGCMRFTTNYGGAKRLVVSKKSRDWDRYDRVGLKFRIDGADHKTGLVVWPQGNHGQAGYYFVVGAGNKDDGDLADSKNYDRNDIPKNATVPTLRAWRAATGGELHPMPFRATENLKDVPNVHQHSWHYLEVEIFAVGKAWEFDVYVDGQYFKTYWDNNANLQRNEVAGMVMMGDGSTLVDRFYVVNYPREAERQKDKDDGGWVVRRQDLWRDRKHSAGDKLFEKYLRWIENRKDTELFEYDFSGRTHAVAREKIIQDVRYEQPAFTARLQRTNHAVNVIDFKSSTFGATFTIMNKSEKPQLLYGTRLTNVAGADRKESMYIYGESLHEMDQQEVEYKSSESIDRIGPLPLEFEGKWIQSREMAKDLAVWVKDRFEISSEVYMLEVFGNPTLKVGSVVQINYPLRGFEPRENGDPVKWVIQRVEHSWSDGLETTITVRRIAV